MVMHNQLVLISNLHNGEHCNNGDSGSLVWFKRNFDDEDYEARPVALPLGPINGKLAHMTIINPLAAILHHLSLFLELPGAGNPSTPTA